MEAGEAYAVQVLCHDGTWMDVGDPRSTMSDADDSLAIALAEPSLRSAPIFRIVQLMRVYDRRGH